MLYWLIQIADNDGFSLNYEYFVHAERDWKLRVTCKDAFKRRRDTYLDVMVEDVNEPPEDLYRMSYTRLEVAENLPPGKL